MGVTGLHKFISPIIKKGNLSDHEGRTVAIDASSWLHKGLRINPVAIAEQQHNNEIIDGFDAEMIPVEYVIRTALRLMEGCGVNPYLVIDGPALPTKEDENKDRLSKRKEAFGKAKTEHASGNYKQARSLYMQACGTRERMQHLLVEACATNGIQCIVSPHEADAQLVSLVNTGQAYLAISEDSDLMALGCQRVLYKLDLDNFTGDLVLHDDIFNDDLSPFKGFTVSMMAIHSIVVGNDYSDGVPGYGHTKARALVRDHTTPEGVFAELERLNNDDTSNVFLSAASMQKMKLAYNTMQHYPVFVRAAEGSEYEFELSYLAQPHNDSSMRMDMDKRTASGIACGILDDGSGEVYQDKFDDIDGQSSSTGRSSQSSHQAEARHMKERCQWLEDQVSELKADDDELKKWLQILAKRENEFDREIMNLPKDDPLRNEYKKYQWAAEARLEDLKRQLPDGVSLEDLEEHTQLQCIVILREFVLNDDGTVKDNPAMLNACKYMPRQDGIPRRNEMIASLCDTKHHGYAIKKTDSNNGRHFKRDEVHLKGTGDLSDEAVLQVQQIQLHSGKGDVAAFVTEHISGELFRTVLHGAGLSMNRCVNGVVRDIDGIETHASGVLVILDPLVQLKNGTIGINKRQTEKVLSETKKNLSSSSLLTCTTERARGSYKTSSVNTAVPFVISTELIPTSKSVVTITRSNYTMKELIKVDPGSVTIDAIGDGKQVISAGIKFPHDIFVVPFTKNLGLHHKVGDTPNQAIFEALVARDSSNSVPILLSTSEHDNEGTIVITNGIGEARSIIRIDGITDPKSPSCISEANLLKSGPIKVVLYNFNGLELYVHLYDPEVHFGSPGEVFDASLCEALKSRVLVKTQHQSQGAVIMYATKDDADRHHRPLIGAYNWRSVRSLIGGRLSNLPDSDTAIAGMTVNSPSFGDVYVRGHTDGDPVIDGKKVNAPPSAPPPQLAFFPQAGETDGLVDRIPPDATLKGKDKPAEPEPESEPEPEHATTRSRRASKRKRSA